MTSKTSQKQFEVIVPFADLVSSQPMEYTFQLMLSIQGAGIQMVPVKNYTCQPTKLLNKRLDLFSKLVTNKDKLLDTYAKLLTTLKAICDKSTTLLKQYNIIDATFQKKLGSQEDSDIQAWLALAHQVQNNQVLKLAPGLEDDPNSKLSNKEPSGTKKWHLAKMNTWIKSSTIEVKSAEFLKIDKEKVNNSANKKVLYALYTAVDSFIKKTEQETKKIEDYINVLKTYFTSDSIAEKSTLKLHADLKENLTFSPQKLKTVQAKINDISAIWEQVNGKVIVDTTFTGYKTLLNISAQAIENQLTILDTKVGISKVLENLCPGMDWTKTVQTDVAIEQKLALNKVVQAYKSDSNSIHLEAFDMSTLTETSNLIILYTWLDYLNKASNNAENIILKNNLDFLVTILQEKLNTASAKILVFYLTSDMAYGNNALFTNVSEVGSANKTIEYLRAPSVFFNNCAAFADIVVKVASNDCYFLDDLKILVQSVIDKSNSSQQLTPYLEAIKGLIDGEKKTLEETLDKARNEANIYIEDTSAESLELRSAEGWFTGGGGHAKIMDRAN